MLIGYIAKTMYSIAKTICFWWLLINPEMHQNDRAQKVSCRSLLEAHFEPFLVQVVCCWFWWPLGRQKLCVFRAAVQVAFQVLLEREITWNPFSWMPQRWSWSDKLRGILSAGCLRGIPRCPKPSTFWHPRGLQNQLHTTWPKNGFKWASGIAKSTLLRGHPF